MRKIIIAGLIFRMGWAAMEFDIQNIILCAVGIIPIVYFKEILTRLNRNR